MKKLLIFLVLLISGYSDERFVESEETKIFCRTIGQGQPIIVIHGGPGLSQDYLLPQFYDLAKNHFVIFYDQRGAGQSKAEIDEKMTIADLIRDLENLQKELGLNKISILGHSWGGLVAMQYAIVHPDRVDKLILSNSAPASLDGFKLFEKNYMEKTGSLQEEIANIQGMPEFQYGDPELHEKLNRIIFRTFCHIPENADQLNLRMSQTAWANFLKINPILWANTLVESFDLHEDLKKLTMPALIIHGVDDPVPLSTAQRIHECIPGSELIIIDNCGHFPYIEQEEIFFKILGNFLRE